MLDNLIEKNTDNVGFNVDYFTNYTVMMAYILTFSTLLVACIFISWIAYRCKRALNQTNMGHSSVLENNELTITANEV